MNIKTKLLLLVAIFATVSMACVITFPGATRRPAAPAISAKPAATSVYVQPTAVEVAQPAAAPSEASAPIIATTEDQLVEELYKRINPAVVSILTYTKNGQTLEATGQGSGWLFDEQGDIVTNSHVVHGTDALEVVFSDNTTVDADLVGEDMHSDLAVVKVKTMPDGVRPLPLADISKVAVGQTVVAIGNPFGLGGTLTRGIVSALGRTIPALTAFSIPQAIQTDAPINPGNSGGPLLNLEGQVIGVNAQIETGDGSRTNSGIGFAIPVSIVGKVVPMLIQNGKFEWGWLGVMGGNLNPALVQAMNLPVNKGAYVSQTVSGGPAAKAGLHGSNGQVDVRGRSTEVGGDVIIAIDGQPVASFDDILIYIALNSAPGQTVTLTILRDGKQQDVPITLQPRPNEIQQPAQQP
jgi:serine protease Do